MMTNSLYKKEAVDREKSTIHSEVLNCHKDYWNTILETSHYLCYRDSVMGLPILGLVDNINKISSDLIWDYFHSNYYGENIIVSGAGGVPHEKLCELVEKTMGHLPKVSKTRATTDRAMFNPGYMWIDEPDTENLHYCLLYEAPSYSAEDYFGMYALNTLVSESQPNASFVASMGFEQAFQIYGNRAALIMNEGKFKSTFLPYSDTGVFSLYYSSPHKDAHTVERLLTDYMNDLCYNVDLLLICR